MASTEALHQHRFSQQQPQHHEPQRLSGIYQYHNAPEVLPEHGLEYDDNTYPVSDKYPVTSMDDYPATSQSSGGVRTIAATEPTTTPVTSTTASTTALSTPTFVPLSACPTANNTLYTSSSSNTSSLIPSTDNTTTPIELTYTRYCDTNPPTDFQPLTSGFVYTFDDCIEVCATYNAYAGGSTSCNVAVYDVKQTRPINCVVGNSQNASAESLGVDGGLAVALLRSST
ncbi:unnamed protein product [Aureobasidium mustum]|uniref:Uncharacterized protein n=1 Tax=Aureobasidium mustum TaxID=2773714 RepID=A0A9N8K4Q8_9PEZI|nr:unnamed protein product [Aureobasidium mustum]